MTPFHKSPPYEWFAEEWSRFVSSLQHSALAHAQLLCGDRGIGVLDLAYAQAKYLLCLSRRADQACDQCKSCHLFNQQGHPDFALIDVEEGASAIKIDQVRDLSTLISQTSQLGGAKVILLHPPEAMNVNAANALLKNLEEPPANTYFILVTHAYAKVMATIRSRCVIQQLATPSRKQAERWLESEGCSDLGSMLEEAGGAPLTVRAWLRNDAKGEREQLLKQLTAYARHELDLLSCAKSLIKLDYGFVLSQVTLWLQHSIKVKQGGLLSFNSFDEQLTHCSLYSLFNLLDKMTLRRAAFEAGANLNTQIVIEELLMDIAVCQQNRPG